MHVRNVQLHRTATFCCSRMLEQVHMCAYCHTSRLHPVHIPLFNSMPDSAASHRLLANQTHAMTVRTATLVTHSHKVLQMSCNPEHICRMQSPHALATTKNNTFQLNDFCSPFLVFEALHFKALLCKLLLYKLEALMSLSYISLRHLDNCGFSHSQCLQSRPNKKA